MLRDLIVLLKATDGDPETCAGRLLDWSQSSPSSLHLELDLRTARAAGTLDEGFTTRLLTTLDDLERSERDAFAGSRRLAREIAEKDRQLTDLAQRTEALQSQIAAAEARCAERRQLEEQHEQP
jgi:hypothetical protein